MPSTALATFVVADVREPLEESGDPTHELVERETNAMATLVECDVTDRSDLEVAIEAAEEYGGVDVMVNNAGIYIGAPFREVTREQFDRLHAVNARGVYFGTQVAANDMIERGEPGSIVNTASISSNVAQPGQVQYDSTKGAVRMITRGAALELAEYDIRVNAVAPGVIATEIMEGWSQGAIDALENEELVKQPPLGRAGVPEDVAGPALFLASDDAEYITGALLDVDGGWQVF